MNAAQGETWLLGWDNTKFYTRSYTLPGIARLMNRMILIWQNIDLAFLISDHFKKAGKNNCDRGRSGFTSDAFTELINNQW